MATAAKRVKEQDAPRQKTAATRSEIPTSGEVDAIGPDAAGERINQSSGSSLPLVSVLDRGTMETAKDLLLEAKELRERMDRDSARLDEIKHSLIAIAEAFDLSGLRWGPVGMEYHGMKTKLTLDKAKLLEAGVSADMIALCYKESAPFPSARFVEIR